MRLTLRTLLAYRDHVLKPAELEDMHARVQQSAMAANLLKRIETLVNRPTILAPPIEGKGLGADANSIAEYLDDALKRDKVPELERICLESDVQLAELAQCHQLLSTALSTSVEIPPRLRERIVRLGDAAERAKALAERPTGLAPEGTTAHRVAAVAVESPASQRLTRERSEASSATHDGSSAAGDGRTPQTVKAQLVEAPMLASGGESIRPTGLDLEGSHLAHEVPEYLRDSTRERWRGPIAIGALVAVLALLVWQSLGSWDMLREMFAARTPAAAGTDGQTAVGTGESRPRLDAQANDRSTAVGNSAASTGATQSSVKNSQGRADTTADGETRPAADLTGAGTPESESDTATAPSQTEVTPTRPQQPSGPHAAEWLPSDPQAMRGVILAYAGEALPLHRVQAAERLPSGTRLIVPPASRPKLDLAKGPRWTFCGPTQMAVALPEAGQQAVPRVDLILGRALISSGAQGQAVAIQTPDTRVLLTLSDAAGRIAVELSYVATQHGPVSDRSATPPVLHVYAIDSAAGVTVNDASHQLPAGQMLVINRGTVSPAQTAEAPSWIDAASDRPVDVLAAEDLQRQLSGNQPVGPALQGLVANRRPETRSLAAQTLAMLGSWDWVTAEKNPLNDSRDRSYWTPLLDLTRQVIAANPEDARRLREVLVKRDPARGEFQADMWIGLSQAQLQSEGLSKMVDLLDSDVLLDRILAIYQLQRLTGKDFGYQAGEVNRASVQQWNRELASGRLQINPPGSATK